MKEKNWLDKYTFEDIKRGVSFPEDIRRKFQEELLREALPDIQRMERGRAESMAHAKDSSLKLLY